MTEPLKTTILKSVETEIGGVSGVASVKRNPSTSPARETAVFPHVAVYDDDESTVVNNRYDVNTMPVQTEVYYLADEENASDRADLIDASIYKALLHSAAIRGLVSKIYKEPGSGSSKWFLPDGVAALVNRYVIVYQHIHGDPFDPGK
jgi:hypothetical protein